MKKATAFWFHPEERAGGGEGRTKCAVIGHVLPACGWLCRGGRASRLLERRGQTRLDCRISNDGKQCGRWGAGRAGLPPQGRWRGHLAKALVSSGLCSCLLSPACATSCVWGKKLISQPAPASLAARRASAVHAPRISNAHPPPHSIRFLHFLRHPQEDARLSCFKGSVAKSPRSILDGVVVCVYLTPSLLACGRSGVRVVCVWCVCVCGGGGVALAGACARHVSLGVRVLMSASVHCGGLEQWRRATCTGRKTTALART